MEEFVNTVIRNQTDPMLKNLRSDLIVPTFKNLMESGVGVAYGVRMIGATLPVGFLLATQQQDVYNGKKKAFEFLFMVDPRVRKLGFADKLLREFEAGAKEAHCESAVVGAHVGFEDWQLLDRYYKMKGYKFLSESLQKTL